jgi:hypothetical protein
MFFHGMLAFVLLLFPQAVLFVLLPRAVGTYVISTGSWYLCYFHGHLVFVLFPRSVGICVISMGIWYLCYFNGQLVFVFFYVALLTPLHGCDGI